MAVQKIIKTRIVGMIENMMGYILASEDRVSSEKK